MEYNFNYNFKKYGLAISIILMLLFLISCAPAEKACSADSDCVPAQCCHPTEAVNAGNGPDCSNVACTMECRADTLDCGQGEIKCLSGECAVVLTE